MSIRIKVEELPDILIGSEVVSSDCQELNFTSVHTDSREVCADSLFFARPGNTQCGSKFIPQAIERGAVGVVCENNIDLSSLRHSSASIISVPNADRALGELAAWWRKETSVPSIGITGSSGKTSCKSICAHLLGVALGQGNFTQGSLNNHVGLPLSLLGARRGNSWGVYELGMNHAGEIDYLGSLLKPELGIILNIGLAHSGNFESSTGVADAKTELVKHIQAGGKLIIPAKDDLLEEALARLDWNGEAHRFQNLIDGSGLECEAFFETTSYNDYGQFVGEARILGESVEVISPLLGWHNQSNTLASLLAIKNLYPEVDLGELASACLSLKPVPQRLELKNLSSLRIVDDTWNSNPSSLAASLETVSHLSSEFSAVLGPMGELGNESNELHYQAGLSLAEQGCSALIAVGEGESVGELARGAKEGGVESVSRCVSSLEAAHLLVEMNLPNNSLVLAKASRVVKLEKFVEELGNI